MNYFVATATGGIADVTQAATGRQHGAHALLFDDVEAIVSLGVVH